MSLRASAIKSNVPALPELARIEYGGGNLCIAAVVSERQVARLRFESVEGFRVLDEGDLLEFWPTCSWTRGGWLWRIEEGGWFAFESSRPGFTSEKYKGTNEYLVVGANECVSVISRHAPEVTDDAL